MSVPISYVFDKGFERCTLVSVFSLLSNSSIGKSVLLFCGDSWTEFRRGIPRLRIAFPESNLELHPLPGQGTPLGSVRGHISAATLGRLLLPDVIVGRTLYIDGDTIIRRDISMLLDEDRKGQPIGGCRSPRVYGSCLVSEDRFRVFWRKPHLERVESYCAVPSIDSGQYSNAGVPFWGSWFGLWNSTE